MFAHTRTSLELIENFETSNFLPSFNSNEFQNDLKT